MTEMKFVKAKLLVLRSLL